MTRRYLVAALAGITSFAFAQTEPLPKAETILDHYIEVTGGKAAYEKRKNQIETGTIELKAQGLKGTVLRYAADPAEAYSIVEIEGVGKIEDGLDKGVAWDKNPMLGPKIKTGQEKAQYVREAAFNSPIRWRELNSKVETVGTETIDGELTYKVVLTPTEAPAETMYFQKKSGLAVKTVTTVVSAMGEAPVEMFASDYKTLGGILVPTKITEKLAGQEIVITLSDVKTNQPIPPDRFDPPAEIKALLSKAAEKK
ncbi:MAG TPA: hypothetical protein VK752_09825 [Bryobacteraceae bacterium]|jgi:hypothetical protein|nr:hypothetical protein [Bryobacteraceae bacterium]